MKFLNFLKESKNDVTIDEVIENCKPYLQVLKSVGFKELLKVPSNRSGHGFSKHTLGLNGAIPKGPNNELINEINDVYAKVSGTRLLSNAIACSQNWKKLEKTYKMYSMEFIPTGNCKFYAHPKLYDAYWDLTGVGSWLISDINGMNIDSPNLAKDVIKVCDSRYKKLDANLAKIVRDNIDEDLVNGMAKRFGDTFDLGMFFAPDFVLDKKHSMPFAKGVNVDFGKRISNIRDGIIKFLGLLKEVDLSKLKSCKNEIYCVCDSYYLVDNIHTYAEEFKSKV